jgi:hypothetical protein
MKNIFFCLWISVLHITGLSAISLEEAQESMQHVECKITPHLRKATQSSFPHIKVQESTSLNWSGYAAVTSLSRPSTGVVTAVSGSWTVPTLQSTPNNAFSSAWVGIDGYASGTVEQIGTEHDWFSGAQSNYAWFEMFPQGAFQLVGFPVNNGDVMEAQVRYVNKNQFQLILYNLSQRVYFVIPPSYTRSPNAQRSSAEWIVEAPSLNGVLPLADFGHINFTNCQATINGKTGAINSTKWKDDPLTMATSSGILKAVPSVLMNSGENFTVTWDHQ